MAEISNKDLMLAITELGKNLNEVRDDVTELKDMVSSLDNRVGNLESKIGSLDDRVGNLESKVGSLDTRVANLESEQKIMREEMNQNFRKLDKKISIFADDLIDVRSDTRLLEEKIG